MPQMMPLHWIMLYLIMNFFILFIMMINYFSMSFMNKNILPKSKNFKFLW